MKYRILVLLLGLLVFVLAIPFYSEYATEQEQVWKKLSEVDQAVEHERTIFSTENILLVLTGVGLVILITRGMTILESLVKFTKRMGKNEKE